MIDESVPLALLIRTLTPSHIFLNVFRICLDFRRHSAVE
jgi:hypothetical protein